jgi:hypothetical protein
MRRSRVFCYPPGMADEEDEDAPDSEEPASEKPKGKEKAEPKKTEPEPVTDAKPDKPVSKSVEWGIAIAMMLILVGFLFMMIHLMRSARSAVM